MYIVLLTSGFSTHKNVNLKLVKTNKPGTPLSSLIFVDGEYSITFLALTTSISPIDRR